MRSIQVAEWILGLVTSADRAASTTGDLAEESQGPLRFWSSVARTASALLWCDIAENPWQAAKWGLIALAIAFGFQAVFIVVAAVVGGLIGGLSGVVPKIDSAGWRTAFLVPSFVTWLIVGRILARLAPGREVTACASYTAVNLLLTVASFVVFTGPITWGDALYGAFLSVAQYSLVLAGALWGRHRRLRQTPD
jgi:hypothetical protein